MGRSAAKSVQDLQGGFCMRLPRWESVEMTHSLHMGQHDFPSKQKRGCCKIAGAKDAENFSKECLKQPKS